MTVEQLLTMPGDTRHELVDGVVATMSPAGWTHGLVAATLLGHLFPVVADPGLGRVFAAETAFRLARDPDTVRAPDLAFVRGARLPSAPDGFADLLPDLVAEVVSPADSPSCATTTS